MALSWLRRLVGERAKPARREHHRRRFWPRLETLEDRWLPSTVTNLNDSGDGSLRQALLDTPPGGIVTFQFGLTGTIALTTGELAITNGVTIGGPGADLITVSGSNASRVFSIAPDLVVYISSLTIADGHSTTDRGGGIYNVASTLTIDHCIVTNNSVTSAGAALGGGIMNEGGDLSVIDSIISGNSVTGSGPVSGGAGIANIGTLTVVDSTISGNSANGNEDGGGILNRASATISGSTLSGNSAGIGGAIDNAGALTMTNCTLSGNAALFGSILGTGWAGGIYSDGRLSLTSCTVSANSAERVAGGFMTFPSVFSPQFLRNTIIAGNSAPPSTFSPDLVVPSSEPLSSLGYNLIGDGHGEGGFTATDQVGTAANPIDPVLGPLQNNGGPTQTMAPLAGSPALNTGDPGLLGAPDQRGVVRSGGVNSGAYQASADHLVFLQQPADTATRETMASVIVQVVDQFGKVVAGDNTDTITLSIGTNPGGGTLSGTLTVTVTSGVATFGDLSIDLPGKGYTLRATAGGSLPDIDSDPFNIT
jgi:hypothetical protein